MSSSIARVLAYALLLLGTASGARWFPRDFQNLLKASRVPHRLGIAAGIGLAVHEATKDHQKHVRTGASQNTHPHSRLILPAWAAHDALGSNFVAPAVDDDVVVPTLADLRMLLFAANFFLDRDVEAANKWLGGRNNLLWGSNVGPNVTALEETELESFVESLLSVGAGLKLGKEITDAGTEMERHADELDAAVDSVRAGDAQGPSNASDSIDSNLSKSLRDVACATAGTTRVAVDSGLGTILGIIEDVEVLEKQIAWTITLLAERQALLSALRVARHADTPQEQVVAISNLALALSKVFATVEGTLPEDSPFRDEMNTSAKAAQVVAKLITVGFVAQEPRMFIGSEDVTDDVNAIRKLDAKHWDKTHLDRILQVAYKVSQSGSDLLLVEIGEMANRSAKLWRKSLVIVNALFAEDNES